MATQVIGGFNRIVRRPELWCAGLFAVCAGCGGRVSICDSDLGYIPLDESEAELAIHHSQGLPDAEVVFAVEGPCNRPLELFNGQEVRITNVVLADERGTRGRVSISAADAYEVSVREPSIGVQSTIVDPPQDFDFVEPAGREASLSGFTLSWSPVDPDASVQLEITQVLFDRERRIEVTQGSDTGEVVFTADVLRVFNQGAELEVVLTKTRTGTTLAGFSQARVTTTTTGIIELTPRP